MPLITNVVYLEGKPWNLNGLARFCQKIFIFTVIYCLSGLAGENMLMLILYAYPLNMVWIPQSLTKEPTPLSVF